MTKAPTTKARTAKASAFGTLATALAVLLGTAASTALAQSSITQWKRDPVRIRATPTGSAAPTSVASLPERPPVRTITPEGLVAFQDRTGQLRYVSKSDVVVDPPFGVTAASSSVICSPAPTDKSGIAGSLAQQAPARPTTGQGYGGGARRC